MGCSNLVENMGCSSSWEFRCGIKVSFPWDGLRWFFSQRWHFSSTSYSFSSQIGLPNILKSMLTSHYSPCSILYMVYRCIHSHFPRAILIVIHTYMHVWLNTCDSWVKFLDIKFHRCHFCAGVPGIRGLQGQWKLGSKWNFWNGAFSSWISRWYVWRRLYHDYKYSKR